VQDRSLNLLLLFFWRKRRVDEAQIKSAEGEVKVDVSKIVK